MDLMEKLKQLRKEGLKEIKQAADQQKLNDVRVNLVGRKGELT